MNSQGYLTQNAAPWAENWPGPQWNTFTPLRTGVKLWTPSSPENTSEKNKDGCEVLSFPYGTKELDGRVVLLRYAINLTDRHNANYMKLTNRVERQTAARSGYKQERL